MQLIGYFFKGKVDSSKKKEFGSSEFFIKKDSQIFKNIRSKKNEVVLRTRGVKRGIFRSSKSTQSSTCKT